MRHRSLYKAAVGSKNYNLNIPGSDDDYKLFVVPTFDDLYKAEYISKSVVSEETDVNIVDIRLFPELMKKSNVNFSEVLFSENVPLCRDEFVPFLQKREEIARMNLPYLFNACVGMSHQRISKIVDKTTGEFSPKNAYQSVRILDFLRRYRENRFEFFGQAMRYQPNEPMHNTILDIRFGKMSKDECIELHKELLAEVHSWKEDYLSKPQDDEILNYMKKHVYSIVYEDVQRQTDRNSFVLY